MKRDPIVVHCDKCGHEWAIGFFPIKAYDFARIGKAACPSCKGRKVMMGEKPKPTNEGDAYEWLSNGDTGLSSLTIWHALMRGKRFTDANHPYDPSDFGRCYRLLKIMPAWRSRLGEVAEMHPKLAWCRLVPAWDELTALYEEELKNASGMAPKLYARMQELLYPERQAR